VNRGMQIRRSPCLFFAKSVDPPILLFKSKTTITSGKVDVNAIDTSNFAQIVKKATCLMTIIQYNSNNNLTPELTRALFKKRNNLDELTNILTKAEERYMIQISFRTQDPNIKTGTVQNPREN